MHKPLSQTCTIYIVRTSL